jgi:hypothetical protein
VLDDERLANLTHELQVIHDRRLQASVGSEERAELERVEDEVARRLRREALHVDLFRPEEALRP